MNEELRRRMYKGDNLNIVIPMAGLGTRFSGSDLPKPLIVVDGKTLIEHSVDSLGLKGQYIFITRRYDNPEFNESLSSILKNIKPYSIEIQVDADQYGAADSALYAKEYIDNDTPLLITNCDQITKWDPKQFLHFIKNDFHGCVAVFKSDDPKNSFAEISDGLVLKIAEKDPISSDALVGIHFWKKGSDFVFSADKLLSEYKEKNIKECYISLTYNYLIEENMVIVPYRMPENSYVSLGTPNDVEMYLAKIKEYYTPKPKTIFCDIDGTILKHSHRFGDIVKDEPILLDGVIQKFNEWDSLGHKIILTTARKESARHMTERHLSDLGVPWDLLIMGITSGPRYLINDKLLETDTARAIGINIITDSGFSSIDWEEYSL